MTRKTADRIIVIGAGVVIVALTGAAFWLSYAHLAEIAREHGLSGARAWAWPATLDLGIVAGELLMLRAAIQGRTDWWAIGLMVAGSIGSIVLNVAGVGNGAEVLDYVVAAVPPAAALIAFGVMMRQIHRWLAHPDTEVNAPADTAHEQVSTTGQPVYAPTAATVPEPAPERPAAPTVDTPAARVNAPAPTPVAAPAQKASTETVNTQEAIEQGSEVPPLVICGGHRVHSPEVPARRRLSTAEANRVIEQGWKDGASVRETARRATRVPSRVQQVYARLDAEHGPRPVPGQLSLVKAGAS
ncbi:DUF2637 domain-containing protein [Streptomyces harbinensis]|uniref:DUF2637 domain-containing protein n=1 Tax=Streptomyces harbinensis TaxID=1176198 RepID=UPI00367DB4B1